MTRMIKLAALAAALAATPAIAQISVGGRGGVSAGVGVDTRGTLDSVRGPLDRTVVDADRVVNRRLQRDLEVATDADLRGGAVVRDSDGRRVGIVQSVHAGTAVVVRGNRRLHVPVASLYRSGSGLVTSMSRAQLNASARADARASASSD